MPTHTRYEPGLEQRGVVRITIEDGRTARCIEVAIPRGGLAPLHRDHDLPFGGGHRIEKAERLRDREESIAMIQQAAGHLLREQLAAADPVRGYDPPPLNYHPGKYDAD